MINLTQKAKRRLTVIQIELLLTTELIGATAKHSWNNSDQEWRTLFSSFRFFLLINVNRSVFSDIINLIGFQLFVRDHFS